MNKTQGDDVKSKKIFFIIFFVHIFSCIVFAQSYVPGEVIVKLKSKNGVPTSFSQKIKTSGKLSYRSSIKKLNIHRFYVKPNSQSVSNGSSVQDTLNDLRQDPDVEFAEPNYYLKKQSIEQSQERLSLDQVRQSVRITDRMTALSMTAMGGSSSSNQVYLQSEAPIHLDKAWELMDQSQKEIIVAVIDTGLDIEHPAFINSQAIWNNQDEIAEDDIDNDQNGYIDDIHGWDYVHRSGTIIDDDGHGTHVSGIILGSAQDLFASNLIASKIKIMPLKFLDNQGSGTTLDAVAAIYYAVDHGAKIINCSWGGPNYSSTLHEAVNYAYNKKVLVVAAAGNGNGVTGLNNDVEPLYPANLSVPNVISVAATTNQDILTRFSNYGIRSVHIGSPGESILSTYPNASYGFSSGTSMATPLISGIAALMAREAENLTGYQLKDLIFSSVDKIEDLSDKVSTGGRINSYSALALTKASSNVAAYQPNYNIVSDMQARNLSSQSVSSSPTGGCGLVNKIDVKGSGGSLDISDYEYLFSKHIAMTLFLLFGMMPFVVVYILKYRSGSKRRKFSRYQINSLVKVQMEDRELIGSVSSISLGGAKLNIEEMLHQGGSIKMTILGPDGKESVDVEGQIVWLEENSGNHGIKFLQASKPVMKKISTWTKQLMKA